MLISLTAQGYGLVETGDFGSLVSISLEDGKFTSRELLEDAYLAGVSSSGERLVVFSRSNGSKINITTPEGEVVRTIAPTVRGMTFVEAELSPDGAQIAFVGNFAGFSEKPAPFGIQLLTLDGKLRTLVPTPDRQHSQSIGWSKDSRRIVYDTGNRIFIFDLSNGSSEFFADGNHPAWSPDGEWIGYVGLDGYAHVVSPDRARSRKVLDRVKLGRGLRWSPDSRYMLYADWRGIEVLDLSTNRTATVYHPIDPQVTEARFCWVHRGTVHQ